MIQPLGGALAGELVVFAAAWESFLIFQQAAVDGDLPTRFADPQGRQLGWRVNAPGLRLLAPDLRSERTRRCIMDVGGWTMMEEEVERYPLNDFLRVFARLPCPSLQAD